MEAELNRVRAKVNTKAVVKKHIAVQDGRLNSKNMENTKAIQQEVPSIRLSPEQIEEVHTDEYSLTLFYATRMEPMSLLEMKRQFPEPEPKKVQSIMDRYIKVGLVHITSDGKYYSNFPENYINYSHYRYDSDLEARKDSKVFQIMKEQTGKTEFWKDKTYFSMDAFYSEEQSKELLEMFKAIKLRAKTYANQNAEKKSIKGLKFRRMKFFDMTFAFLIFLSFGFGVTSQAMSAGGNDPHRTVIARAGGGNDPTGRVMVSESYSQIDSDNPDCGGGGHDPNECFDPHTGGGGHDPAESGGTINPKSCFLKIEGRIIEVKNQKLCKLQRLIDILSECEIVGEETCNMTLDQIEQMTVQLESQRHE